MTDKPTGPMTVASLTFASVCLRLLGLATRHHHDVITTASRRFYPLWLVQPRSNQGRTPVFRWCSHWHTR